MFGRYAHSVKSYHFEPSRLKPAVMTPSITPRCAALGTSGAGMETGTAPSRFTSSDCSGLVVRILRPLKSSRVVIGLPRPKKFCSGQVNHVSTSAPKRAKSSRIIGSRTTITFLSSSAVPTRKGRPVSTPILVSPARNPM